MSGRSIYISSRVSSAHGDMYPPPTRYGHIWYKEEEATEENIKRKIVFSVGPKTWRVLWDDGSTKNWKENTLNYMGEGPPLPDLLSLKYDRVLTNGTDPSPILPVSTTLVFNLLFLLLLFTLLTCLLPSFTLLL